VRVKGWRRRRDPIGHLDFESDMPSIDLGKQPLVISISGCSVCGAIITLRFNDQVVDGAEKHQDYHIGRGDMEMPAD
jgi:hypothetical protein